MCFFEKKGSNMRQVSFSLLFCLWDFFLMGLIFLIGPIKFCDMGLFMGLKLFDLKWDCFFLWSTYFVILKVKTFKRDCTSIFKIYLVGFLNFLSRPEVRRICYFFMQIWETCVFMCVCVLKLAMELISSFFFSFVVAEQKCIYKWRFWHLLKMRKFFWSGPFSRL